MRVLVDYSCARCRGSHEAWVSKPVPAEHPCPVCGTPALRRFGGALLRGAPAPDPTPVRRRQTCREHPMVPGLCHMTPSAARGWIARAQRDGRALDHELAQQESAVALGHLAAAAPPISHDHGPGHHGHGHAEGADGAGAPAGRPLSTPPVRD